jgi:RimJ/RimL family protein N-acetyltransferase
MDRVFRHHGAHRLWLDVFVTNTRARRLYASLGFREEGLLRDAILRDGEFHSQVLMSLLEHEYTERQPQTAGAVTLPGAE